MPQKWQYYCLDKWAQFKLGRIGDSVRLQCGIIKNQS